jgi:hypothetical protein
VRTPGPLVRLTIQFGERLAHHTQLGLAVQFEYFGIPLPKHLRHHVIGDAASAQPGSEGMSIMPLAA